MSHPLPSALCVAQAAAVAGDAPVVATAVDSPLQAAVPAPASPVKDAKKTAASDSKSKNYPEKPAASGSKSKKAKPEPKPQVKIPC